MKQGNYKSGIYVHLLVQFYHTIFLPFTRHNSSVVDTLFSLLMVLPRLLSFETFEWKLCSARVGSLFRFAKYASFDCLPLWSQLGAPHGIRRSYGWGSSEREEKSQNVTPPFIHLFHRKSAAHVWPVLQNECLHLLLSVACWAFRKSRNPENSNNTPS